MAHIFQAAAIALAALGTGAATLTAMNRDLPDLAVPERPWFPGHELDGLTFYTTERVDGSDEVLSDELVFRDGTFQSVMCEVYCDFGWSGYRTWTDGETIHFTATTECPDEPHRVVWHGQVTGDAVRLEGSWTTRRWYWTHQITFTGEGTTTAPPSGDASG